MEYTAPITDPQKVVAVVIGKEARHIVSDEALDYVAGYTVGNIFARNL